LSKFDFPVEEFFERRTRVRESMHAKSLDWLVLIHPAAIHWLTGSEAKSYQAFQCLLLSADADRVVMITREAERAEFLEDAFVNELHTWGGPGPENPLAVFATVADGLGLRQGRVGLDIPSFYLNAHHHRRIVDLLEPAVIEDATNLVHALKLVKSPRELAYIREASRIADMSIATSRMRALYELVREASDACISEIRDGVSVGAPFEAARRVIARGGLEAYSVHTVGYSVGAAFPPSTGEPFNLAPSSAELLKAGMVLSICPPIFIPEERLGARLVDNVLVTPNGAERLSRASKDLIVAD
jgi:Xaa-Pro aminopeptidase